MKKVSLVLCCGLILCWIAMGVPVAAGDGSKIAFSSNRDGNHELYTMDPDGTRLLRLTNNSGDDESPDWSPDGSRIAFISFREGNVDIYTMDPDGKNQVRLTTDTHPDSNPAWSADGSKIAFDSYRDDNYEIYTMDADGSSQVRLTTHAEVDRFPAWSPDGSKIVFSSKRDGDWEIYTMDADGSNQTRITNNDAMVDWRPDWSPDGSKIAFCSDRDGNYEIYTMDADGSNQTRITMNTASDDNPEWSWDGTKITFESLRDLDWEIYTMDADGSNQTRITTNIAREYHPAWSPPLPPSLSLLAPNGSETWVKGSLQTLTWEYTRDPGSAVMIELLNGATVSRVITPSTSVGSGGSGSFNWTIPYDLPLGTEYRIRITSTSNATYTDTSDAPFTLTAENGKIAFDSDRDGNYNIYTMDADGKGQTRITADTAFNIYPSWSPDGATIAFQSNRDGPWNIYTIDADGTGITRLSGSIDRKPAWSPDGSKIAFESYRDGNSETYVMNADGTGQTRITNNGAEEVSPAWSPDGSRIAFHSNRDGNYEIYTMNADGTGQTRITNNGAWDSNAAWSPDGSRIAFHSDRDGNYEIYTMNTDGTDQTRITTNGAIDQAPSWSPDGTMIAFTSKRDGNYEIYTMKADGNDQTRITTNTVVDSNPAWSQRSLLEEPSLLLLSPDGGDHWEQGATQTITWNYTYNPGSMVMIELLKGTTVEKVISSGTSIGSGGGGSCTWTVPFNQTPGSDYTIRITSTSNPLYTDTSDAPFSIGAGAPITVVTPNGGERWKQGSTQTLKWNYTGDPGSSVKIEVLKGTIVRVIAPNTSIGSDGSGSFNFTFPFSAPLGSDYLVRITSISNATCTDTSDAPFTIIPPLTVLSPNGGEEWEQGTTQTISWNYIGDPGPSVKIEALRGDTVLAVITPAISVGTGGSGSLNLPLPINAPLGTEYRIRVSSTSNPLYTDTSDAPFAVVANASSSITLVTPNGGEDYVQGSNQTIRWNYTGNPGPSVKIEALRNGTVLAVITPSTSVGSGGSGSFNLTFPYSTPVGSGYRIRVTSTTNPAWTDVSEAPFTVSPAITVLSPDGGEEWEQGSTHPLTWTYSGNPGPAVKIEALRGDTVLAVITQGTPIGPGLFNLTFPANTPLGTDYRIRITSTAWPACTDTSNGMFAIIPA
ncbi:MAG: translocation protein TolB [Euryarchaeota archaeon ADurb.BinA087]|nr:MAG: translocation protein TolB [Euryarchaeota archaeon ADurb.BinA087]